MEATTRSTIDYRDWRTWPVCTTCGINAVPPECIRFGICPVCASAAPIWIEYMDVRKGNRA